MDLFEFYQTPATAKIMDDKKLLIRISGDPVSRTVQEKRNDDKIKVIRIDNLNKFKDFTLDQLCIQLRTRFENLEGLSISSIEDATARIPYLQRNKMIHHIPESICGFPKLTVLCLRGPILTLPENLGNLTNLTIFRLDAQKMLGASPVPLPADMRGRAGILLPESIGMLENLRTLECTSCNLQVMPPFVLRLSKLQVLTIDDSSIREIPERVLSETMNILTITNSGLESLPESIGNLTRLNTLSLNGNHLTTLPSSIGNLARLKTLQINNNRLTTLPDTCRELMNLVTIELNNNQLTTLPPIELPLLKKLDLSHNRITVLPDSIGSNLPDDDDDDENELRYNSNARPMEFLNLSHNNLTAVPASFGNLRNLRVLNLSHNPDLRVLPQEVLALRAPGPRRQPTDVSVEGTGLNAQHQIGRINSVQVHKEFAKIDIRSLFMFIAQKVPQKTLEAELRSFDITRVAATLRSYIVRMELNEAAQKRLLDNLRAIYSQRLEGYGYDAQDKKVIVYCMTYVATQPERFQSEYARAFVEDCGYDAYGGLEISCVKGIIERFVSTLRLAALLYDGTPEYNSRQYGELASIIGHKKIGSLKEHMNDISQDCYEKSQNNNGNADETKFRKCMTDTLKAKLGNQFNETNSTTKNTLNQVVRDLRLFDGGRVRRTHKKRKYILRKRTIKHKGKRKIRATYKRSH
jgi:Leucine-rich repeat (LRR) protein